MIHAHAVDMPVLERLANLYQSGRLAHAYLFTGPKGVGKSETALAVARMVNCQEAGGYKFGCSCSSCRKIDGGNHPDLFIIQKPEDKASIAIGQIAQRSDEPYQPLLPWLSVKALEARVRVVIIKDADLFSPGAANAFLKTLEEPQPGTLLILTTTAPANILPTIFSRCHEVKFFGAGNSVLAQRLVAEHNIRLVSAAILVKFAGGSLGRAVELGEKFILRKNTAINEFIIGVASEPMLKKWSMDKDDARELSDVVLSFYRDILCFKNGAAEGDLYNSDRVKDIRSIAGRMDTAAVEAVITQAVKAREAVNESFNVKVALTLLKELI